MLSDSLFESTFAAPPMFTPRLSLGLLTSLLATVASAQTDSTPLRTCWRGRPQPACDVFWVTELGLYPQLAGSGVDEVPNLNTHGAVEIGRMVNQGRSATGILVSVGQSRGSRFGVLYRHRRWLGTGGTFDLTGGGLMTNIRRKDTFGEYTSYGVTGDIALGWRDYGQLSLRGDLVRGNGYTDTALYGGIRLGSRPAAVTAVTGGALLAACFVWYAISMAQVDDF